jgi:hypothetical protein
MRSGPFGHLQPPLHGPSEVPQILVTPSQPPQRIVNEAHLTSPVPRRPIKNSILDQHPPSANLTSTQSDKPAFGVNKEPAALITEDSKSLSAPTSTLGPTFAQRPAVTRASFDGPTKPPDKPIIRESESVNRRQSLFERQEKLLHDQLRQQERERQVQLELEKAQRQASQERLREQNRERELTRAKESALLEREKQATKEQQERACLEWERKKVERERSIHFYTAEIVDVVIREHIFGVAADVLAVEHYRRGLLRRTLRRIKKISARSLARKQAYIEQLRQLRNRKRLLARALTELDNREAVDTTKKKRRRSHHVQFDNEDELEEILIKVLPCLGDFNCRREMHQKRHGSH